MSYKKLKNFQAILNREDFNYISNNYNIKELKILVLLIPTILESDIRPVNSKIKIYLRNLDSFYNWTRNSIPEIREGCLISRTELLRFIGLFEEELDRRKTVGYHQLKKFFKKFISGLNKLLIGIGIMFDPDIVGNTTVTREQLASYILDKKEGLGRKYEFNTLGKESFVNMLSALDNKELIATEKMLVNPQIRKYHTGGAGFGDWRVLGESRDPVRILLKRKRVYFLFRVTSGHETYDRIARIPPTKFKFSSL